MRLNVAIDGPVGAGKSTVADAVAARLGILHLDTGDPAPGHRGHVPRAGTDGTASRDRYTG